MRTKTDKKFDYLEKTFSFKHPLLEKIKSETKKEGVERQQVSAHEARILQFLTSLSKAKKVVEIGTLYAFSTFHIALALGEEGQIWTLDKDKKRHETAKALLKSAKESKKIQWMTGSAMSSLKLLEKSAPFDMVFIDADKGAYLDYLNWAEQNLREGGLLVADNTFLFGAVYGEDERHSNKKTIEIMRSFNKKLAESSFWNSALIPTSEGLTVAIKLKN